MMKNLTLIVVAIVLLKYCAYCQSNNSRPDTLVYGNVQSNFPGGQDAYDKYLSNNGAYPESAKSIRIQGCVYIRFVIEKDSTISNVHMCDGVGSRTEDVGMELIRNSGKWIPRQINSGNVRTLCIVPVRFSLSGDENPLSKSSIYGDVQDYDHFNLIKKVESLGMPVTEASNYINKNIRFMGKVYGTKTLSDTVFIMTCGNINQSSRERYVNVVLMGKGAFTKNLNKQDLNDRLVTGIGSVILSDGIPVILISDDKKCQIIQQSSKASFGKFRSIYDFGN